MKDRKEIDPKYKWDLSAIFKTEEDYQAEFRAVEKAIGELGKYEKTMLNGAKELYETLKAVSDVESRIEVLWIYASLNYNTDTSDNHYQALNAKIRSLAASEGEATWYVSPYLLRLDEKTVESWLKEYPALESYRRQIEKNMRSKPYTLSDESEALMSKLQDCLHGGYETRSIFANSDLKFGKITDSEGKRVELTDTAYIRYLMGADRKVRRAAFTTLYKTYEQFGNTFATLYNNHVKEATTLAKIRGYKSSFDSYTFRDEVTPAICNNLISCVHKGLPALYEYYEMKREVLGLDKLHLYDIYTPLIGSLDREYTYEEAVDEVLKTATVFGGEYYDTLKAGLCERGWVDVYPSKGKRGGAFSSGCPGTEPYILLNFNGTFNNVSTLAHEAGHSMHTYFSTKYNEPHNSGYTIFVAEVASTVNELLMSHRLLRESKSDEEKLYLLNELMETYKGTLYRQTMFAEFERDMHALVEKGEVLTAELVNKKYYRLVCKYFGKDVVKDKQIQREWMRIPHFYNCFYVYKYATCISAASAIVKRIESEGESYISKYIDFLKCGDSRSPLDSLKVAGIDMTSPEVVNGAIEDFSSCVKQFKEIMASRK